MPMRCGNCIFSEPTQLRREGQEPIILGRCHLNPPSIVIGPEGVSWQFPLVQPMVGWCGSWSPKEGFSDKGERIEQGEPQPAPALTLIKE